MDVFSLIGAGSTLTLVGLCYKLANDKNGKYVPREICELKEKEFSLKADAIVIKTEAARNILESKIVDLKNDISEIKIDVKEILRNGKN